MSFTTDPTTTYGKLRLLTTDRNATDPIYQDADYDAFLELESSNTKRAAALALECIATDQVLVLKVMTTLKLTTNGAAVAKALLDRASALRDSALFDEAQTGALWDTAEFILNEFQARDRYVNEALKNQT